MWSQPINIIKQRSCCIINKCFRYTFCCHAGKNFFLSSKTNVPCFECIVCHDYYHIKYTKLYTIHYSYFYYFLFVSGYVWNMKIMGWFKWVKELVKKKQIQQKKYKNKRTTKYKKIDTLFEICVFPVKVNINLLLLFWVYNQLRFRFTALVQNIYVEF